jgi:hypothetical protein
MEPFNYRSPYGDGHHNRHITTNIFLETLFYSSHISKLSHYWDFAFLKVFNIIFEMNLKTFWPDLRFLAFCFSSTVESILTSLLLVLVHVLVSLGKKERKVKNKKRGKMKDKKFSVWKYDLRKKVIEDEKTFWYFCYL